MSDLPEILTVDECAAFLQISRSSAYQAVKEGALPSFKVGRCIRISKAALLNWINAQDNGHFASDISGPVGVDSPLPARSQQH